MHARAGDVLVIEGKTVGRPARRGTIVEVRSPDGLPPYWVRWEDGHEGLAFPGPDAHVAPEKHSS
ncbi:MAG TPA: DUF1918 domain-containing protein [Jatrophihabitans sp.]|jgi:hypothetical protein|nr:DUF1918 domain-containing protein [Jatrophihabitans sp.]